MNSFCSFPEYIGDKNDEEMLFKLNVSNVWMIKLLDVSFSFVDEKKDVLNWKEYKNFDWKEGAFWKIKLFYIPENKYFGIKLEMNERTFVIRIHKDDRKKVAFGFQECGIVRLLLNARCSLNAGNFIRIFVKKKDFLLFKSSFPTHDPSFRFSCESEFLINFRLRSHKLFLDYFSGVLKVDIEKENIYFLSEDEKRSFKQKEKKLYYIPKGFSFEIFVPDLGGQSQNSIVVVKVVSLEKNSFFFDSDGEIYFPFNPKIFVFDEEIIKKLLTSWQRGKDWWVEWHKEKKTNPCFSSRNNFVLSIQEKEEKEKKNIGEKEQNEKICKKDVIPFFIVFAIFLISLLLALVFYCWKRKKSKNEKLDNNLSRR